METKFNFTKAKLDGLPKPETATKRLFFSDDKVTGLRVQITFTGVKSFQVVKRVKSGKTVFITLGRYPDMTIDQARKQAQFELAKLADGINPNQVKKVDKIKAITLKEVLEDYLKARKNLKPRTIASYRDLFDGGYLSDWQDKPISSISRDMVSTKHNQLGEKSPACANRAMRVLSALFNFAIGEYEDTESKPFFTDNPVRKITHNKAWFKETRRETYLRDYEIKPFFDAVMALNGENGGEYWQAAKDYFRISLLTGMRLEEVLSLKWANIDFKDRILISEDTKNRLTLVLPLSDYLFDLLAERKKSADKAVYVFASAKSKTGYMWKPKRQFKKIHDSSAVDFTAHDFRRTFLTIAEKKLKIPFLTAKRLVNHVVSDVTAGYVIYDIDDLRAPMQQITDYILKVAGVKQTAEIIPLAFKKVVN